MYLTPNLQNNIKKNPILIPKLIIINFISKRRIALWK